MQIHHSNGVLLSLINCFFCFLFFGGALGDFLFWCLRPSFFDGALGDLLFGVFDLRSSTGLLGIAGIAVSWGWGSLGFAGMGARWVNSEDDFF